VDEWIPVPTERTWGGYDGNVWEWRVQAGDHTKTVAVKVSGTAIATYPHEPLLAETAGAIRTQGRSAVEETLTWAEPPDEIEFTTSTGPIYSGGVRSAD
jgi:hypothetical protein